MDMLTAVLAAAATTWSATAAGAALVFVLPRLPRAGMGVLLGIATVLMAWAAVAGLLMPAWTAARAQADDAIAAVGILLAVGLGVAGVTAVRRHLAVDHHGPTLGRQLFLVMTLHHLPEGMAVGLAVSAAVGDASGASHAGALALVAAMAIHNAAEGALVSLPLHHEGMSRRGAFLRGQTSALAEVAGALLGALAASLSAAILPWGLAVAAGAMGAVVLGDLLPGLRASLRAAT